MTPLLAISPATSERLKGIAILLMLTHHLFGLPTLIEPPAAYLPLLPGVPLEYWLGRFGKICVALFLLLSAYGFAAGGVRSWRYYAGKAGRFLAAYWPYFLLAWGVGIIWFQEPLPNGHPRFPTDPLDWLANALTLKHSMAFEWWFAETYLLLVLLTRPLLQAVQARPWWTLAGAIASFAAGAAMDAGGIATGVISLSNLLIWQLPFTCGLLLATLPRELLPGWAAPRALAIAGLAGTAAGFALVEWLAAPAMTPFLILASPALAYALATLAPAANGGVLGWLGQRTLGLWLVHPFFCYYFFQPQIYTTRLSLTVFIALLASSLLVVLAVEGVRGLPGRLRRMG